MHLAKVSTTRLLVAVLFLATSAAAQQITFEDFSSTDGLTLNGPAHKATWNDQHVLRLTDGLRMNIHTLSSTVWANTPQPLTAGFTTYFQFQVHNPAACCTPGDGFAFVIQNSSATDYCGSGSGITALGVPSGGMGYTGIRNSLAIEFDTTQDSWDPNGNHIAMQSCGTLANSAAHVMGSFPICGGQYTIGSCLINSDIDSGNDLPHLGVICGDKGCQDGAPHYVVVEYTGVPTHRPGAAGTLQIYVDPPLIPGTHTPAPNAVAQINTPFTIDSTISLNNGAAYVGFSASQANESQTTDLLVWEFTPHTPTEIQEKIDPMNGNPFNFGDHLYNVKYPDDTNTMGDFMTVEAIPIDKQTFFLTRLAGTQFSNEQCLTYLSTGGNCIIYRVTCQDSNKQMNVDCPNPPGTELIDTLTRYSTSDGVNANNADYIKTPIGTNNWCSIFTTFTQNDIDPTTSGHGNNFSDFVATFKPHGGTNPQCNTSGQHLK